MRSLITFLSITTLIFGCQITKEYVEISPRTLSEHYGWDDMKVDTVSMAAMSIDEFFDDEYLLQLIESGLKNNNNLGMAMKSIQIANAYYLQGKSAYLPSVDAYLQPGFTKNSKNSQFGAVLGSSRIIQSYQLGVSAAWEADIWGKLKSQEQSLQLDFMAAQTSIKWAQTQLISNIASLYFQLIALDEQKAITQKTIENRMNSIQTTQALKDAGLVTEVAVKQTEAQLYQAQALVVDLNKQIQLNENTLNALLSRPHQVIERGSLDNVSWPSTLAVGVPSQLLENRPDLKVAEYEMRSAFEMTNVARTYFYPALRITASTGLESIDLGKLISPKSLFANLAAGLTQPLANKRVNKTRLEVAQLQYDQAVLSYEDQFLYAVKEVSDALYNADAASEKQIYQEMELASLKQASEYSKELLNYGMANYLEVLRAEDQALSSELNIVTSELNKWSAVISLYKALGGGW